MLLHCYGKLDPAARSRLRRLEVSRRHCQCHPILPDIRCRQSFGRLAPISACRNGRQSLRRCRHRSQGFGGRRAGLSGQGWRRYKPGRRLAKIDRGGPHDNPQTRRSLTLRKRTDRGHSDQQNAMRKDRKQKRAQKCVTQTMTHTLIHPQENRRSVWRKTVPTGKIRSSL